MDHPEKHKWNPEMKKELNGLNDEKVWSLVELPPGVRPIRTKWVYHRKMHSDGSAERNKARLATKGILPRSGVDFAEIYGPIAK